MWTKWHSPFSVSEYETDEIKFSDGDKILDSTKNINTIQSINGVSTSYGDIVTQESNALLFTDFQFSNISNINKIEIKLEMSRLARIQDKQIQLYFNEPIGSNNFDLDAADLNIYSGDENFWGVSFSNIDVNNTNFGVLLDFQPHIQYPSSNTVYIRKVQLRLEYT